MKEIPKSIKASLYIDGKPAEASIKNIRQVTNGLRKDLDGLTVGTDAWNAKMKELQLHEKTLNNIKNEVKGVNGAFGFIKTEVGKIGALAAGYLGFQFVTEKFQNIITSNAKLSDSLADIRRVTGLTEEGVRFLDASLGKLETRTSKSGLRDIAVIAGKLGVAKNDILGFVEATDKLVVALGDELGDADQVTTQLGKILNVFDGEVTGDNITRLGNAMVKLANDGVASAGFIAEFTQRVSGVAKSSNLSLGATLGLAAGLEELGAKSESSSTALQNLLFSIANDIPKAASIAQIPQEEFNKLFAEKPQEALLKYAAGLVKNKGAFSEVTGSLKDAGEEGVRVISTITQLGQKTDFFSDKIKISTEALNGYNEINDAFNLKSQTMGAKLDTLGKDFTRVAQNKTMVDLLTRLIVGLSDLIGWIDRNSKGISNLVKFITVGGAAWLVYRGYILLVNSSLAILIRTMVAGESVMALSRTSTIALAGAKAILAGNFTKAAQAARLLNVALAANPIGLVLAGITATIAALVLFNSKLTTSAKIQGDLNEIQNLSNKNSDEEANKLKQLSAILSNNNSNRSDQIKAIQKIRELYPEILKGLTDEEALTNKGTVAINKYIEALDRKTSAEAAEAKIKELKTRNNDLLYSNGSSDGTWLNQGFQSIYSAVGYDSGVNKLRQINMARNKKEIEENNARITEIQKMYGAEIQKQLIGDVNPNDLVANTIQARRKSIEDQIKNLEVNYNNLLVTDKSGQQKNIAQRRQLQKELDQLDPKSGTNYKKDEKTAEKAAEKAKKLFDEAELERIASLERTAQAIMDSYAKELSEVDEHFRKLKEKHSTNAAAVNQIEQERLAKLKTLEEKFRKDDLAKLQAVQNEISQLSTQAMERETDRLLSELQQQTREKLQLFDQEDKEIRERVEKQKQSVIELKKSQKNEEAQILEDAIARELLLLDASGKLREAFLKNQGKKEVEILKDAANNKKLSKLEADLINAESADDENGSIKAKLALLKFNYDLEIEAAERLGKDTTAIAAKYIAERQALENTAERKKNELILEGARVLSDSSFRIINDSTQRASDARISAIERERDRELSNRELTDAQKYKINQKFDERVRREKERSWKAEQRAAIAQALINGAIAMTKVSAQTGVLSFAFSPLIAAQVAAQVAVIAAQKMPQFAIGGFSDSDPEGYVGQPTIFRKSASGRPFVAGEAGREWIAPNWMLQDTRFANIIGMLEAARIDKRAFASGGMTGMPPTSPMAYDFTRIEALLGSFVETQSKLNSRRIVLPVQALDDLYEDRDRINLSINS